MRVLVLTDWMTGTGGAEEYALSVRRALVAAGDTVRLVACGAVAPATGTVDEFIEGTDHPVAQSVLQVVNPVAARRVRRVAAAFQPDIVLASAFLYHLSPSALRAIPDVPIVVTVMDYKLTCPLGTRLLPDESLCDRPAGAVCWRAGCLSFPHWLRDQGRYARVRGAMRRVAAVIVPSQAVHDIFATTGIESVVLPLPVRVPGTAVRRRAATPTFTYCGRLSREKGVGLLLQAFARVCERHPSATLRLLGDGGERRALEREAGSLRLGDRVTFRGHLGFADVEVELQSSWALVAPSLWAEPFGLVAPEAIVRHVPVIASRTGGFAETVVDGVTGLLVPNGDVRALADAMDAIAGGRAFPGPRLPDEAVARLRDRTSEARHAASLRALFGELVPRGGAA